MQYSTFQSFTKVGAQYIRTLMIRTDAKNLYFNMRQDYNASHNCGIGLTVFSVYWQCCYTGI